MLYCGSKEILDSRQYIAVPEPSVYQSTPKNTWQSFAVLFQFLSACFHQQAERAFSNMAAFLW
jgi:hypothetical protein